MDEFYDDIETLMNKVHKKDIIIVMGDWNAQIGEGESHPATGKFGYGTRTERGTKLLEFAGRRNMVVANTLHRHKVSRRVTWHSPDGVPKRFKSSANTAKTRTFRNPDIGRDHEPVMATIKLKLTTKNKPKSERTFFDLDKLKDETTKAAYQSELASKFAPLLLLENQQAQELCDEFTKSITATANNVLGKRRKTRRP